MSEKNKSFFKEVWSFCKDFVVCAGIVLVCTHFIARPIQVKGSSMYPTLEDKEIGISNILGKNLGSIDRFDIVIVHVVTETKNEYLVKRAIGLPGETIYYEDDKLYVNGEYVEEPFLDTEFANDYRSSHNASYTGNISPLTLGEDEYFCLGDNRPGSSDSRVYGPFKYSNILGKGVVVLFPFNKAGVHTW